MNALPEAVEVLPRRRRRRRRNTAPHNQDRWMVSYADFVTLLFAFFTTLYAISKVDVVKLTTMVQSVHLAFEPSEGSARRGHGQAIAIGTDPLKALSASTTSEADVQAQLTERLADDIAGGRVSVQVDARGLVISMHEAGAFAVGSSDMTAAAREVLLRIASTVRDLNRAMRVEGHTDDVPIHTARYASNWELSTARATSVVQFLIDAAGMPAARLAASGYGEFHPGAPNDSAENRARNRRVDIVILNSATRASEEPPTSSSPSSAEIPRDAHS